ncbi:hypothetical protein Tsubulata_034113 [Turnera subulata]|uniref:Protein Iojap, chloroplastic n=1 Tax=Turnera subulata TaxID=218843 RepID=A0A9Q0FUD2_9ROSI|nr:hypothetical protein Tsubulata_034113 [Turnera subulata]
MAVSATLSTPWAVVGTRFSGDWQRLRRRVSPLPRQQYGRFGGGRHQLTPPQWQCFWEPITPISKTKTLHFNQPSALPKDSDADFLSNLEDNDEMLDDLLNEYGKVVIRNNNKKPATAEVDDDSESLLFAVALAKVASDVKAAEIKVLFVKPLVYWTQFFIIATAFSSPQINAICTKMRDLAEKTYGKVPKGDTKPNTWTLLDFGDVVVHIFLPPQRAFYNLEEFYGNATPIELPFDNQTPFGR